MTMPPGGPDGPPTWMTAVDVFHIDGRGTVVTGRLEGYHELSVGDIAVCEGQRWQVGQLSQLRVIRTTADPGTDVGVLLRDGPPADVLKSKVVVFEPGIPPDPQPRWKAVGPKKRFGRR
jgi:translation elongation factor EF-Tu-like GTPase